MASVLSRKNVGDASDRLRAFSGSLGPGGSRRGAARRDENRAGDRGASCAKNLPIFRGPRTSKLHRDGAPKPVQCKARRARQNDVFGSRADPPLPITNHRDMPCVLYSMGGCLMLMEHPRKNKSSKFQSKTFFPTRPQKKFFDTTPEGPWRQGFFLCSPVRNCPASVIRVKLSGLRNSACSRFFVHMCVRTCVCAHVCAQVEVLQQEVARAVKQEGPVFLYAVSVCFTDSSALARTLNSPWQPPPHSTSGQFH